MPCTALVCRPQMMALVFFVKSVPAATEEAEGAEEEAATPLLTSGCWMSEVLRDGVGLRAAPA